MKIAIIGAGVFGNALGGVLTENGYEVDYFDVKFNDVKIADVVSNASYVVLCIPSCAIKSVLPGLPKDTPLIIASKGILKESTFNEFKDYMIISGPGFADDVVAKKQILLTATDKRIIDLFTTDYLHFDFTKDVRGVLMCGAFKNVYAIGAGLRGIQRDTVEYNDYIKDVCAELKEILKLNGANPETVDLACGILDIKLTCGYPSRNYEFGDKFRQDSTYRADCTVEGMSTIKLLINGAIKLPEDVKILNNILEVFKNEFK